MTAIVKYNAGNVRSVQFALERLGEPAIWTDEPGLLRQADRVIFPGVGEASSAMAYLRGRGLNDVLRELQQPVLGICLGLQLFCRHSEENDTACLGIFDVAVRKFTPRPSPLTPHPLKVPHMGWNTLRDLNGPLFEGVEAGEHFYFVHSFFAEMSVCTTAVCDYGTAFSAALHRDNVWAVQFHPEKSGAAGQQVLRNFLKMKP